VSPEADQATRLRNASSHKGPNRAPASLADLTLIKAIAPMG
jgi:hypothetical protein